MKKSLQDELKEALAKQQKKSAALESINEEKRSVTKTDSVVPMRKRQPPETPPKPAKGKIVYQLGKSHCQFCKPLICIVYVDGIHLAVHLF